MTHGLSGSTIVVLLGPVIAAVVWLWVYRDSRRRGYEDWALWIALAIGGLLLTGSLPGLVALAIPAEPVAQGFPTSIRIVPGLVALSVYVGFQ